VILETERLILRPYRVTDAAAVHEYGSDPEVCRYTEFGPNTWEDTVAFLASVMDAENPNIDLAITVRGDDAVVGGIGARRHTDTHLELGWVLRRDLWGHGIGTEAARAMFAHVAALPGTEVILCRCRPQNPASARIMEKIGMEFVERIDHEKEFRGEWVDTLVYQARIAPPGVVPA
jgi:ribosomal-protein-alanine N-acetyltransferase